MAQNGTLSPKQQRAVAALLTERTISDAATAAKVSRRTLTTWLGDAQFCAELRRVADTALSLTVQRMSGISGEALDVLLETMRDKGVVSGVKVHAANVMLSRLATLHELHELEARIAALEQAVKNGNT